MNINHHNYEEYFILYMDNELSSDDRRMVEAFVQQHPDLKEELDLLLQYKLVPDNNIVFNGKEELLKVNGETPLSLSNFEEWAVLYFDNELKPEQRILVEQFVAANPALQDEFNLLQRSHLQPEQLVFTNKEILYRKEEKVRTVPLRWWRAAAAAILIFAAGTTAVLIATRKSNDRKGTEVAKTGGTNQNNNTTTPAILPGNNHEAVADNGKNDPVNSVTDDTNGKIIITPSVKQDNNAVAVKQNNKDIHDQPLQIKTAQSPVQTDPVVANNSNNDKPSNNLPKSLYNSTDKADDVLAYTGNVPNDETRTPKNSSSSNVTNQSSSPSNTIQTASYTTPGDNAVNQPNDKKSKLRGFFRKVTRTFEKRTNIDPTDDDKLLVGGLAIKLR